MSLIDDIAKADDLKSITVDVDEWGVSITLQEMAGFQRADFEKKVSGFSESGNPHDSIRMMALIIVMTAIDDKGNLAFTEKDIDTLAGKSLSIITKLSQEAMKLSELSEGDVEELAKN